MTRRFTLPVLLTLAVLLAVPGYAFVESAGAGVTSTVHRAPTSIDRTGKADVSVALNAFIRSVPDGSMITFPADSYYRVENIILVGARHNLVIDGAGSTFFATTDGSGVPPTGPNSVKQDWPRHRNQWLVFDSSNIVLRNLSVRGANAKGGTADDAYVLAFEAQAGVEFFDTTHSTLENCKVKSTFGDLVYIGNHASGTVVRGCSLAASGRQGVTVAYGSKTLIDHNDFLQIRRSAIDLEPFTASWGVTDVWIIYNTFRYIRLDTVAAKAQGDVSGIVIAFNHVIGGALSVRNTPDAIVKPVRHDWHVIRNVSDTGFGSPHGMIWITNTHTVTVRNNFLPVQAGRGQLAVQSTGSTNVQLSGNSFPGI